MIETSRVIKKDNLLLAFRRLLTNPESTYKNFFRDTYATYAMCPEKNLELLRTKLKSGYLPNEAIRVFMPKPNGLNRMYKLLSIEDQIVYQAYANILANSLVSDKEIRKRYKKIVFGNMYTNERSEFFYKKWQNAYIAYTKSIINAYNRGNKYIASFDLTACYDSLNHELLSNLLKSKCKFSDDCSKRFVDLLKKWGSVKDLELSVGIPQGPQASGIVSEVILTEYDALAEQLQKKLRFHYCRYVDDIRVLAEDESTVRWVLFLLDKKSKELGLFPQSSKIAVHKIDNIYDEVKQISRPLFEDEFDSEKCAEIAASNIKKLIRKDPVDITAIRRYFHFVKQESKSNKLVIMAVKKFPHLIQSFAYYVQRYPRKIPPVIYQYIYECCQDKTQQFASGILLELVIDKLSVKDAKQMAELAKNLLNNDAKSAYIVDSRFRLALIMFVFLYGDKFGDKQKRYVEKSDWWIKSKFIYQVEKCGKADSMDEAFWEKCMSSTICDLAIAGAKSFISSKADKIAKSPRIFSDYAQVYLKEAGLIKRGKFSKSQIPRYFNELVNAPLPFEWKKKLPNKYHDQIERKIFLSIGHLKTDLAAFVNLWDTIDDLICSIVVNDHPELGGYSLGQIGGIQQSKKFKKNIPNFFNMCVEIHEMRLKSHFSHAQHRSSQKFTGPIPQKYRKKIIKLIHTGFQELIAFW